MTEDESPKQEASSTKLFFYGALDYLRGSMSPEGFRTLLYLLGTSHGYVGFGYAALDIIRTWNNKRKRGM